MHYPTIGPFLAYLFMLSALLYIAKTSWVMYKGDSGGAGHLALTCISFGLLLFMTVVPGVASLSIPNGSTPYVEFNPSPGDF
jgi:hypothetical protein